MARDWSLSRFVRLYVVESADEAAWDWQARCVWPLLIKAADRAGVIETSKGAKGLAAVIRMPLEVVAPALEELTADGCLIVTPRGYLLRNYLEAQNAKMAGSQRQAEYKARERAKEALNGNEAHAEVTRGDTRSREVTAGDAEVTLRRDEQSRPSLSPLARDPSPPAPAPAAEPSPFAPIARHVTLAVGLLNAARLELDPAAQPVDADQGDEMAAAAHLRALPEDRREAAIRHGVAAIAAAVKAGRETLGALRPGELFGPRSWRKWQAAPTVITARGRDGPGGGSRPARGLAAALDLLAQTSPEDP